MDGECQSFLPFLSSLLAEQPFKAPDEELSSRTLSSSEGGPVSEEVSSLAWANSIYEVEKYALEAKIDARKKAKYLKPVSKMERKEAAINEWDLKNTKKAMEEMKKFESKLERKRLQALEKTQKNISRTKKEASRKKSKARRATIDEISAVSKFSERIRTTKGFLLLKLKKFC